MMGAEKIFDGVFLVGSEDLSGFGDCLVYAIEVGKGEICLIDCGTQHAAQIVANLQELGYKAGQIRALILTHCHYDHIGAAHQLVERCPDLEIYAHSWDIEAIEGRPGTEAQTAASWYGATYRPVKVTHPLREDSGSIRFRGARLGYHHIPGHTPGSIAVLYTASDGTKILFGQDVHGPFMEEFRSNKQDWANSMKKLLALEADILCEGHYGQYNGKDNVRKFIKGQLKGNGFL